MQNANNTVVWMRADNCNHGPSPLIAAWRPDAAQILRLLELQGIAKAHNLESCVIYQSLTQWGPGSDDEDDFEDENRIEGQRLIVDNDSFFFRASLKHRDEVIETERVDIALLIRVIENGDPNEFLSDSLEELVDDCGGPILRGQ